ncbi:MAG: hypothetical protein DMF51_08605 [Acidobacteria bacterium]|nr:MAG: hypothetical protein DMF51_08605 [Acidobacteriota bacterium]
MPLAAPLALSLFYLTSFAVLGVYLPYFNLYLDALGFSGLQIGLLTMLLPLSGALVPTFGGMLADRLGWRRGLVIGSSLMALVAFGFVPGVRTFPAMVAVVAVYAALRAPALPLIEAAAMEVSEAGGPHYGRMRAWGSLAFIVMALGTGPVVARWGARAALFMIIVLLALNVLSTLMLPGEKRTTVPAGATGSLRHFVRRPRILLFLLACLLSQASHGPYYVFYSIYLEKSGYPPQAIGVLWGIAVACEIVAMLLMPTILGRLGTLPTMGASVLLAAVRWWVCATSAAPAAMILAQTLHAATYAAFHVAAVTHTHHLFGAERRSSGQAIYGSATYGGGNMLGMLVSGVLYDRSGMAGLFAGAAVVALASGLLIVAVSRREARGARWQV